MLAASPAINDRADRSTTCAPSTETKNARRIAPLDFTKGILVMIMILYHWLNYFVNGHDWIYKYLRFLPISFTFISGFLVSQIYLSKYERVDLRIPKRLFLRGVKLLAIVALLNLAPRLVHLKGFRMRVNDGSLTDFAYDYLTGAHPIAFSVLVPIAYLLILSAGLFFIAKHWRHAYHVTCLVLVLSAIACEVAHVNAGYVQTMSIGMLGVSIGHISINQIDRLLIYSKLLFATYVSYLFAIWMWDDSYVLQVVGVCVTLLVIYWCGTQIVERYDRGSIPILLGQYSLFSYIIQIVILQILRSSLRTVAGSLEVSLIAFLACIVCTIVSVKALDSWRRRSSPINSVYKAVFS